MPSDARLLVTYLSSSAQECLLVTRDDLIGAIEDLASKRWVSDIEVWIPGPDVAIQTRAVLMDRRTGG